MVSDLLQPALRKHLEGAAKLISEGRSISFAMEEHSLTTPVAVRMLRVGERTGQMGEMMDRIYQNQASGRWLLANRAIAQLMFWRPVPSFEPSPEALAPSFEMVALQRAALADAAAAGQLGPGADSDEAVWLVSTLITGV